MPENREKPTKDQKGEEPKQNSRSLLIWIAVLGLIPMFLLLLNGRGQSQGREPTHVQLLHLITNDHVRAGFYHFTQHESLRVAGEHVAGHWSGGEFIPDEGSRESVRFEIDTLATDELEQALAGSGRFRLDQPNTLFVSLLSAMLPILIILGFIYFIFFRQIKMAGKGALSFGKSKARMLNKEKNRTTFRDVAGVDEAKDEVSELVDYLRDPRKFQKLGGKIPKGVLMIGSPGTGKTLLAKAIAGEAEASFFSISGSDFVEMFVGVGASRVRDMFDQARKNTPCLIFIDEIDAVGRSRGHGLGGGNDEREQTLNALLVEMDGFETQEGIIIIAATNRPDVLDPALLRPGRFDRQITVNLPDIRGREAILKVHARKVKLNAGVDLKVIARGTPGYSGAELANLLNEAALLAARKDHKSIGMPEMEEARDKVRWGRERRSMAMSQEEKEITAWHEAGHALVSVLLEDTDPLHKVTIIPRGQALGATMSLPKQDILNRKQKEMEATIALTMGGRIGEQFYTHDFSTGAAGDIQQATSIARAMVCRYGMSDKLGMVQYGDDSDYVFLGKDMVRSKDYSESTAKEIDNEVKRLVDQGYDLASRIINENHDKLELLATTLLEQETLTGAQVEEIVLKGTFTPPPKPPDPPPQPAADSKEAEGEQRKSGEAGSPGLEGAAPAAA